MLTQAHKGDNWESLGRTEITGFLRIHGLTMECLSKSRRDLNIEGYSQDEKDSLQQWRACGAGVGRELDGYVIYYNATAGLLMTVSGFGLCKSRIHLVTIFSKKKKKRLDRLPKKETRVLLDFLPESG